jgi:septum formation protein
VRLILASASPRRAELLRAAGFEFDTIAVDVDETPRAGEAPPAYVRRLAAEKSAAAAIAVSRDGPTVVLAADTAVVVDGEILGKPRDDGEAAAMLRRLAGRRHDVMTGISLRRGAYELGRVETTAVQVAPLTDADIAWYVASGEGRDKAGAYAIQGLASRFIPRIEGSYSNVVGLPVAAVYELLHASRDSGADNPAAAGTIRE